MFTQCIKLYENKNHTYVLELWGGSTKHPDSIFYYDEFRKNEFVEDKYHAHNLRNFFCHDDYEHLPLNDRTCAACHQRLLWRRILRRSSGSV